MKVISKNQAHVDLQRTYTWFKNINAIVYTIIIATYSAIQIVKNTSW